MVLLPGVPRRALPGRTDTLAVPAPRAGALEDAQDSGEMSAAARVPPAFLPTWRGMEGSGGAERWVPAPACRLRGSARPVRPPRRFPMRCGPPRPRPLPGSRKRPGLAPSASPERHRPGTRGSVLGAVRRVVLKPPAVSCPASSEHLVPEREPNHAQRAGADTELGRSQGSGRGAQGVQWVPLNLRRH